MFVEFLVTFVPEIVFARLGVELFPSLWFFSNFSGPPEIVLRDCAWCRVCNCLAFLPGLVWERETPGAPLFGLWWWLWPSLDWDFWPRVFRGDSSPWSSWSLLSVWSFLEFRAFRSRFMCLFSVWLCLPCWWLPWLLWWLLLLKLELLLSDDFCLLFLSLVLLVDPACVAVEPSTLPGPPFLPPFMNFKNLDKAPFFLGEFSFCWTAEWLGGKVRSRMGLEFSGCNSRSLFGHMWNTGRIPSPDLSLALGWFSWQF